eukprot:GDKJ01034955.1.p1 GENE.GDKJ01034955.1~~GDKJ01034955.1.p1  ORF type:complete len:672 (-),score=162.00 GDKJ01034955.1:151-2166(-)
MDATETVYIVESSSKVQVSPRNRDRRFSSSSANDNLNGSHFSTQHILNSPETAEKRASYDLNSVRGSSPGKNNSKWIQEDLDAEEEAIKFLQTQTKLVERLKRELREQNLENERLRGRIGKQEQERAEVAALYDELRELESRYRKREEEQARREGESAARQEHFEALRNEQKVLLISLEKDLELSEQRNSQVEQDLKNTRDQLLASESRNAASSASYRQQITALEAECEKAHLELESVNARYESLRPTFDEETRRLREALDEARRDADEKLFDLSKLEEKNALLMQTRTELEVRAQQALARAREARSEADARRNEMLTLEEELRKAQETIAHLKVEVDTCSHREKVQKTAFEQREKRLQDETLRWAEKCAELENDLLRCWQEVKRAQEEELEARRVQDALTAKRLEALQRRHAAEERLRDALVEVVTDISPARAGPPSPHRRSVSYEEIIQNARESPSRTTLQKIMVSVSHGGTSPCGSPARRDGKSSSAFQAPNSVRTALANQMRREREEMEKLERDLALKQQHQQRTSDQNSLHSSTNLQVKSQQALESQQRVYSHEREVASVSSSNNMLMKKNLTQPQAVLPTLHRNQQEELPLHGASDASLSSSSFLNTSSQLLNSNRQQNNLNIKSSFSGNAPSLSIQQKTAGGSNSSHQDGKNSERSNHQLSQTK